MREGGGMSREGEHNESETSPMAVDAGVLLAVLILHTMFSLPT